ncbi:hypothetical protein [Moorena sp. SIO3I6]|uniref:saccharopine dehydrogenase NADP-binding domain-containing protein n=2 Tax=unclassified Moorena TaxID=2683338 RepID=UPI0013F702C4|nr:hypothetical protein [Moorena sp. SIO3I6]NEP27813.1 hypothetical protein [Moorena sp. SIO3I6]
MSYRLLIIGLGDLGQRLAAEISKFAEIDELILAGRRIEFGVTFAELLAACSQIKVRFFELDAEQQDAVEQLLRDQRPDLIVQCASLFSPWYLRECQHPVAKVLRMAGFAAQIPAQLPPITTVMSAVREIDFPAPVVNCSYPDLTHPVLAQLDLAPTVGIGNVGMIQYRVQATLLQQSKLSGTEVKSDLPLVRVLAHHSQIRAAMSSIRPSDTSSCPKVFIGEGGQRADELVYAGLPLMSNRYLNALTTASGLPILQALLPNKPPLRISAPGPLGLPGGYPIKIINRLIEQIALIAFERTQVVVSTFND